MRLCGSAAATETKVTLELHIEAPVYLTASTPAFHHPAGEKLIVHTANDLSPKPSH